MNDNTKLKSDKATSSPGELMRMSHDDLRETVQKMQSEHAALDVCACQLAAIMDELSDGHGISQHAKEKGFEALNALAAVRK